MIDHRAPVTNTGLAGMPRRIPDYSLQFADFNFISSIGGFAFGTSFILLIYIVINCIRNLFLLHISQSGYIARWWLQILLLL
jgi:heme/copper-type cytochrome/quinol oxidase subunit 1